MEEDRDIVATDIPIIVYLNQRLAFDALATLEDGFSHFSSVQTTSSGTLSAERSGEAGIGLSNVFALLGVSFGVRGTQEHGEAESESSTQQIVHTPASLFARLRSDLMSRGIVQTDLNTSDLDRIRPGCFIEFETTLSRNSVLDTLTAFVQLFPLMEGISGKETNRPRKRGKQNTSRDSESQNNEQILGQAKSLLTAVTAEGSQDLVGSVSGVSIVLATEEKYFNDPTMNDVIDGTFRVFGKVIRVIPEGSDENISLLRRAPIGRLGDLVTVMGKSLEQLGQVVSSEKASVEIQGPGNSSHSYCCVSLNAETV